MKSVSRLLLLISAIAVSMPATTLAQSADDEEIEEITVTGTRSRPRTVTDSPVAIDSFNAMQLDLQAHGDLTENIKNLVPSFTATALTGDGSAFIRSTSLRGLPPDEVAMAEFQNDRLSVHDPVERRLNVLLWMWQHFRDLEDREMGREMRQAYHELRHADPSIQALCGLCEYSEFQGRAE